MTTPRPIPSGLHPAHVWTETEVAEHNAGIRRSRAAHEENVAREAYEVATERLARNAR